MKFLLWIAIGLVIGLWLLRKKKQQGHVSGKAWGQDGMAGRHAALPEPERMVRCVQCGVHIPASEALLSGDEAYCCIEHKAQRASRGTQASH
jgi:uncharacterized protein